MGEERPDRIGPYRIEDTLGGGGMGVVYRAEGPDGARVAVKTILRVESAGAIQRFLREADIRIEHPNVIRTLDAGHDGKRPYIALELLDGESLDRRIERGTLAPADAVSVVVDVCAGLEAAHELGIVHRDLKPANVFCCADGQTKVLDFGIARVRGASRLTQAGQLLGTVAYLSPEQARGSKEVTVHVDVWACGLLLYESITGELPFERETLMTTVLAIMQDEPVALNVLAPNAGEALSAVVSRCFAKEAADRWPSVAALRRELLALGPLDEQAGSAPAPKGIDATMAAVTGSSLRPDEQRVVVVLLARGIEDPSWVADVIVRAGGEAVPFLGTGVLGLFGHERWEGREVAEAVETALAIKPYAAGVSVASGRALGGAEGISGKAIRAAEEGLRRADGEVVVDRESAIALDGFELRDLDDEFLVVAAAPSKSEAPDALAASVALVGRELDVATIRGHFDGAFDAGVPACVVCSGPMGIGKSAVRRAVEAALHTSTPSLTLLRGSAERSRSKQPLSTIASALYAHFAAGSAELEATMISSRIADLLGGVIAADCSTFIGELLGLDMPETISLRAARRDPQLMSDLTRMALEDYLCALVARGPVLLRVEDAHLADQVTMQVVSRLVGGGGPLAVFLVTREPEVPLTSDRVVAVPLRPLIDSSAASLVRDASKRPLSDALVSRIVQRAGGNPLFLEQTVLAFESAPDADIPLPVTVEAAVQSRLDELSEPLRELCKKLSVLDSELADSQVLRLFGAESDQLDQLVQLGFVHARPNDGANGYRYTLAGDLLSRVAYRMLPEERLKKLHSHIAQHLAGEARVAPELVASHHERAGEAERAAHWFLLAAQAASAAGDSVVAFEHAARAEELGVPAADRFALAMVRADAALFLGQHAEQGAALELAMQLAATPTESARVLSDYVVLLRRTGRSRDAVVHGRSALRAAEATGNPELIARTNVWQASALMNQGQFDESAACLDVAADHAEAALPSTRALVAQGKALYSTLLGDVGAALLEWRAACEGHNQSHDVRRAAASTANLADAYNRLGAYDMAAESLGEALVSARRVGYPEVERYARLNLAYSRLRLGEDPSELLDEVEALAEASGDERVRVFVGLYRSRALLARGSLSVARDEAAAAGERANKSGHGGEALLAAVLEARACLELGDVDSALELTKAALEERDARGGLEEDEAEVFLARADALRAAGSEAEAIDVETRGAVRLREVAAKIADETWRARFLGSVEANRELLARVAEIA